MVGLLGEFEAPTLISHDFIFALRCHSSANAQEQIGFVKAVSSTWADMGLQLTHSLGALGRLLLPARDAGNMIAGHGGGDGAGKAKML